MRPQVESGGVRFRLFPKPPALHPGRSPETIHLDAVPGSIGAGPNDDRMYALYPVGKERPYGPVQARNGASLLALPPWRGNIEPPLKPDSDGHFDHIVPGQPGFEEAHVFGSVRFVMDIWQHYAGQSIAWHFSPAFERLEISILPCLNNAHAGYGYLEIGAYHTEEGSLLPYSLNFDVIAHETGHLVIYSLVGVPTPATQRGEYFAFHESAADMSALIAALHFTLHVDQLLDDTRGNLYTFNELNRFAELSASDQIRMASNTLTMSDFAGGWTDEHALSQPLTGALFDILIDIFQEELVGRGLIDRSVANATHLVSQDEDFAAVIQPAFDLAYRRDAPAFRSALLDARDYMGFALAETWKRLSPDFFSYAKVAQVLLEAEASISRGRYRGAMLESFGWRGIGQIASGPRLAPPGPDSHTNSVRTLMPDLDRAARPVGKPVPRFAKCGCGQHRYSRGLHYG